MLFQLLMHRYQQHFLMLVHMLMREFADEEKVFLNDDTAAHDPLIASATSIFKNRPHQLMQNQNQEYRLQ